MKLAGCLPAIDHVIYCVAGAKTTKKNYVLLLAHRHGMAQELLGCALRSPPSTQLAAAQWLQQHGHAQDAALLYRCAPGSGSCWCSLTLTCTPVPGPMPLEGLCSLEPMNLGRHGPQALPCFEPAHRILWLRSLRPEGVSLKP